MAATRGSVSGCAQSQSSQLIAEIRAGRDERLGPLLDAYRNYLNLLARTLIDDKLRARVSPSDLVQETMLGACRDFHQFQGDSERQLLAWLRQILIHRLHVFVQHHVQAQKRDVRREVSLQRLGAAQSCPATRLDAAALFPGDVPSPSVLAERRENAVLVADHLAEMSSPYRRVIELRNLRGLSFEEIATLMNRKVGAVRMLWLRAIRQLRARLEGNQE